MKIHQFLVIAGSALALSVASASVYAQASDSTAAAPAAAAPATVGASHRLGDVRDAPPCVVWHHLHAFIATNLGPRRRGRALAQAAGDAVMVKRIAILFPDASLTIMSGQGGEAAAVIQARKETALFNKRERDPKQLAQFGEIEIDLMSFKERF